MEMLTNTAVVLVRRGKGLIKIQHSLRGVNRVGARATLVFDRLGMDEV